MSGSNRVSEASLCIDVKALAAYYPNGFWPFICFNHWWCHHYRAL